MNGIARRRGSIKEEIVKKRREHSKKRKDHWYKVLLLKKRFGGLLLTEYCLDEDILHIMPVAVFVSGPNFMRLLQLPPAMMNLAIMNFWL